MMEGALSLMQMAKICGALARLDRARLPYIAVLTDPTTGGVTASFAMLGDLNIAEPKALIGFAGPRVIEQTIRQKLPEGFQRSEFLLEKGMLDLVVDRREMKAADRQRAAVHGREADSGSAAASRSQRPPEPAAQPLSRLDTEYGASRSPRLALRARTVRHQVRARQHHALVAALGHPERAFRSVHVAGTNGKGSVTAMVDAALRAAGYRIGALHVAASRRSRPSGSSSTAGPVAGPTLDAAVADLRDAVDRLAGARTAAGATRPSSK